VKRRADMVGIFPNKESNISLIGAVLFEQNDDWQSQHRYMMVEACRQTDAARIDPLPSISTKTARPMSSNGHPRIYTTLTDATRHPQPAEAASVAMAAAPPASAALMSPGLATRTTTSLRANWIPASSKAVLTRW
jgi:hypothetical protein